MLLEVLCLVYHSFILYEEHTFSCKFLQVHACKPVTFTGIVMKSLKTIYILVLLSCAVCGGNLADKNEWVIPAAASRAGDNNINQKSTVLGVVYSLQGLSTPCLVDLHGAVPLVTVDYRTL